MNLIVDVGNTFVKFAVFEEDNLIWKDAFKLSQFRKEYKLIKKQFPKLKSIIVSSVGRLDDKDVNFLKKNLKVLELDWTTKVPFKNEYQTPRTLGVDRIALVSASVLNFPETNALIIDAGTCITYDFVTQKNAYIGGAISPGLRLRYKTLNNLTANLPLLDTEKPAGLTGNSTESSIHSGVVMGIIKEIDGIIDEYRDKYPDLTVILTGGDAKFLSNQLKNSIFANSNFLLEGLNFILEFNSK
ncbi:MAG: type III pantothenate kinase [Winogradskyella sp.]|uniref:type III pantothenate kinase n=1 Tax=Winogradskyella sp. TaxID=1883156 RepID=UPI0017CDE75B|nr:type III pantothenate kinase [Winogradskyella sp.]MBT8245574.1 type III pantothenate kinase [Winogradskyella sp.]NNK22844.1 type III pantothenate kinase [Winogradskyella sp.]